MNPESKPPAGRARRREPEALLVTLLGNQWHWDIPTLRAYFPASRASPVETARPRSSLDTVSPTERSCEGPGGVPRCRGCRFALAEVPMRMRSPVHDLPVGISSHLALFDRFPPGQSPLAGRTPSGAVRTQIASQLAVYLFIYIYFITHNSGPVTQGCGSSATCANLKPI